VSDPEDLTPPPVESLESGEAPGQIQRVDTMREMPPHLPQCTAILLNGELAETQAATLAELVARQGFAETAVATAVNGAFVPRGARAATLLTAGDKVEIVAPRQGG
jgi:sulfur carrier protein